MKKAYYFLSLLVLFLASCSSDSENSDETLLLIKKIVSVSEDSTGTINFTYNGTKLNTITVDNFRIEHTYSGDNIVNVKRYLGEMLESDIFYDYDNSGRVSSELFIYYLGDFSQKYIYTYNSNNTISYQILAGDETTQNPIENSGLIYQGSNGEVLKIEIYNQGSLSSSSVYSYDSKNNPFKNITGYSKLPVMTNKIYNINSSIYYNSNQEIESKSTFEYTYNNSNFPSSSKQLFYNNDDLTSTVNVTYFY